MHLLKNIACSWALTVLVIASVSVQARDIVYDAEFVQLQAQNAEQWSAEDKALKEKLAQMREKHGAPPNIIHIMWDDNSLGEVGIPEMNKVLGSCQ